MSDGNGTSEPISSQVGFSLDRCQTVWSKSNTVASNGGWVTSARTKRITAYTLWFVSIDLLCVGSNNGYAPDHVSTPLFTICVCVWLGVGGCERGVT